MLPKSLNVTVKVIKNTSQLITSFHFATDIIVEVDYVRAKVVRADTCVKNGIIHYVDHILGVPYVTVFREMEINDLTM